MSEQYAPVEEQQFGGQIGFRKALTEDFDRCFSLIMEYGFQTGWKKITGKPQHGNFNPNWKDCLDFLQKCIAKGLDQTHVCPDIPITKGLPVDREDFDQSGYWFHMYEISTLHRDVLKKNRRGKRDGTILSEYKAMFLVSA